MTRPNIVLRLFARPPALIGLVIIAAVVAAAVSASVVFPEGPWVAVGAPNAPFFEVPGAPLGSDMLGRNVAAGLLYGARTSLVIGFTAALVAGTLGVLVGALAGYFRGIVDDVLMRVTEMFQTVPAFMLIVVLVVLLQPTLATIIACIGLVSWPPVARLVRGEFLAVSQREFVLSCRAMGMSHLRMIFTEILPNAVSPIIVITSVMVANAILIEAGLAFLKLGDPNVSSWGAMIADGKAAIQSAPRLSVVPGLAIFLTVVAINLIAESLNDVLNPRLRAR